MVQELARKPVVHLEQVVSSHEAKHGAFGVMLVKVPGFPNEILLPLHLFVDTKNYFSLYSKSR